jgi:4-hydroxybutyrate dehydrogenase/sulfolactaldehyde 3-reductase
VRVGFIGLGAMGRPMAANILRRGHELTVYDANPDAVTALRVMGAAAAAGYRELAKASDIVITMLPKPADVEAVVLGDGGVASGLRSGGAFIDMSTGDPTTAQRLAETLEADGVHVVDCPVGRTQAHAEAGTLLLLAGGSDEAVRRVEPVLMCMGQELFRCGGPGMGQAMKLVNNMLAMVLMEAVAEALELGLRAGLSLDIIRSVTAKTLAQTTLLDTGLPAKAFTGDLSPGFALWLGEKDVALAVALAEQLGVAVPVTERTLQCCAELHAAGHGNQDVGVLVMSRAAGLDGLPEATSGGEAR